MAGRVVNAKSHGKGREHRVIGVFCGVPVYADTIEAYVTDDFFNAYQHWQLTKYWGLANGSLGWANEPIEYIDAITALESEKNAMEHEEMEKTTQKGKKMETKNAASPGKLSKGLDN